MKPFFFLFAFAILVGLVGIFVGTIVASFTFLPASHFFLPGHSMMGYLLTFSGIMTVGIPMVGLFYFITRRFREYHIQPHITKSAKLLWATSLFVTAFGFVDTLTDYRAKANYQDKFTYEVTSDTISFDIVDPEGYYKGYYNLFDMRYTGEALYSNNYDVVIKTSEDNLIHVNRQVRSKGPNPGKAMKYASGLIHDMTFDGAEFKVDSKAAVPKGSKFRGQSVVYTVYIPKGLHVKFDKRARWYNFDFPYEASRHPVNFNQYVWEVGKDNLQSSAFENTINFTKTISLDNPELLSFKDNFTVEIIKGEKASLQLSGYQSEVNKIEVVEQGNQLIVLKEDGGLRNPIRLQLTVPSFKELSTSTKRKVRIEGFEQEDMVINFDSSPDLDAYISIKDLRITSPYNPTINLNGKGEVLTLALGRNAHVAASDYMIEELILENSIYNAQFNVGKKVTSPYELQSKVKIKGKPEFVVLNTQ